MITFKLAEEHYDTDNVNVEVTTLHQHLEGVLEAFKTFLVHVGHHPTNIERIVLQGPEERQGLPVQLDLFDDEDPRTGRSL